MLYREEEKILEFQEKIDYQFNDINLLKRALTTPRLGNLQDLPHYEIFEFIGDPILKLILSV